MNYTLSDFFLRKERKLKLNYPDKLNIFRQARNWKVVQDKKNILISYNINGVPIEIDFFSFLENHLPPFQNILNLHLVLRDYFVNFTPFLDGLPIYCIRSHHNPDPPNDSTRRRGWVVKFENAFIVYSDNYIVRHFFELPYFVSHPNLQCLREKMSTFSIPFASIRESLSIYTAFPNLAHITVGSDLYLSHLYDINQGDFVLDEEKIKVKEILPKNRNLLFGCGYVKDWEEGKLFENGKKYRYIPETLPERTIKFLQAYNIRTFSPFNYFPFPKSDLLAKNSIKGEDNVLKNVFIEYQKLKFGEHFDTFITEAAGFNWFDETKRSVKTTEPKKKNYEASSVTKHFKSAEDSNEIERSVLDFYPSLDEFINQVPFSEQYFVIGFDKKCKEGLFIPYRNSEKNNKSSWRSIILSKDKLRRKNRGSIVKFVAFAKPELKTEILKKYSTLNIL